MCCLKLDKRTHRKFDTEEATAISPAGAVTQKLRPSLRSAAEPPAEGCVEEGPDAVPQVLVVTKALTGHDDRGGVSLTPVDVRA